MTMSKWLLAGMLSCFILTLPVVYAKPSREGVIFLSYDGDTFRDEKKITSPVLLFIGATKCDECRAMWDKTLRAPKMKEFIDTHFIMVMSKKGDKNVLKRYHVTQFPSLLVLNSKGEVKDKLVGFHDNDETMKVLVKALSH